MNPTDIWGPMHPAGPAYQSWAAQEEVPPAPAGRESADDIPAGVLVGVAAIGAVLLVAMICHWIARWPR